MKIKFALHCLMALTFCLFCSAASLAEEAAKEFRIGVIGTDPGQILHDFDPFVEYLSNSLKRRSDIRNATLFVAKNLDQMSARLRDGKLDFILTTAFPLIELERFKLAPAVLAWQGGAREYSTVFFVKKYSDIRDLRGLKGKTMVFGSNSSTYSYAVAKAELKKNDLSVSAANGKKASNGDVKYELAGEAINQAFWVLQDRADAGVFSSTDWEELSQKQRSKLRILYRTKPILHLLGSFHPSVPAGVRQVVETELIGMDKNRKGRNALNSALHMTKFELLTRKDRSSFLHLKRLLSSAD